MIEEDYLWDDIEIGDRVRLFIYDEEWIEGVFIKRWGWADDEESGWIIKEDNGAENWLDIRDIFKVKKNNE